MSLPENFDAELIRERGRKLEQHSAQIGRMCTLWSGLELDIALCLVAISRLDEPLTKNVFMGAMDMRAKLGALMAIGHERKPSPDWFERLSKSIKTIDNDIRTERNRMIHDFWYAIPDENGLETLNRVFFQAKLRKEPPSGELKLSLADFKPVTSADIEALSEQIIAANAEINRLRREFELSPLSGKPRLPTRGPGASLGHKK